MYARISRDRVGAGLGVDRQREDCRELAERLGWSIVVEHTDNDLSAYSGKSRPGYRALLADLREGRVDAVIAWHTDRLHRSPVELEDYIAVSERQGAPTHTVKAGPLDLSSPSGRMVARQLGAVARYEVEHQVERQRRAKAQAAADGRFRGGRRPFGYDADGVTVRESEAATVRDLAAGVLAGRSMRALASELNGCGITGTRGAAWTGASIRDVLLRARNAALIEHEGQIVGPARWAAILDEDTWRAVRTMLTDPGRAPVRLHARRWLGSGLYVCGRCGQPARIGVNSVTRGASSTAFYRCSGPAVHVTRAAARVDEYVSGVVIGVLERPDAAVVFGGRRGEDSAALHSEATAVRVRLDDLAALYAAGAVDARQLAAGSERLRTSLADLEWRIGAATAGTALDGLVGVANVAEMWAELPLDRRRAVVATLMTVTLLPAPRRGRPPGWRPGEPYFDPATVRIDPKVGL